MKLQTRINETGAINLITVAAKLAIKDSVNKAYREESFEFLSSLEDVFLMYDCSFPKDLKRALEAPCRRGRGKGNYKRKVKD